MDTAYKDGIAKRIYQKFPGAKQVECDEEGRMLWGEVSETPEFEFCDAIACEIAEILEINLRHTKDVFSAAAVLPK
jgi:hypothetical protein